MWKPKGAESRSGNKRCNLWESELRGAGPKAPPVLEDPRIHGTASMESPKDPHQVHHQILNYFVVFSICCLMIKNNQPGFYDFNDLFMISNCSNFRYVRIETL